MIREHGIIWNNILQYGHFLNFLVRGLGLIREFNPWFVFFVFFGFLFHVSYDSCFVKKWCRWFVLTGYIRIHRLGKTPDRAKPPTFFDFFKHIKISFEIVYLVHFIVMNQTLLHIYKYIYTDLENTQKFNVSIFVAWQIAGLAVVNRPRLLFIWNEEAYLNTIYNHKQAVG